VLIIYNEILPLRNTNTRITRAHINDEICENTARTRGNVFEYEKLGRRGTRQTPITTGTAGRLRTGSNLFTGKLCVHRDSLGGTAHRGNELSISVLYKHVRRQRCAAIEKRRFSKTRKPTYVNVSKQFRIRTPLYRFGFYASRKNVTRAIRENIV